MTARAAAKGMASRKQMVMTVGRCPAGCNACPAAHLFLDKLAQGHDHLQISLAPDFALSGHISLAPCAALRDLGLPECALNWTVDATGARLSHPGGTILRSVPMAGGVC